MPPRVVPVVANNRQGCSRYVLVDRVMRVKETEPYPKVLISSLPRGRPVWMEARIPLAELRRRQAAHIPL